MSEPLSDENLRQLLAWYEPVDSGRQWFDRQVVLALQELRAHRAWKARLGDPETWFPHLRCGPGGVLHYGSWLDALQQECIALVDRAKEDK